jgi:myo-inositol-1(or 4)-monophosphatase
MQPVKRGPCYSSPMPSRRPFESRLLPAMVRAVRAAGRIVRSNFGRRLEPREKSSPGDLVSSVDLEAERRAIGILSRAFPGIPVISEEKENPPAAAQAFYLDPLDGTLNFLHGLEPFAVSLAFWRDGQPMAAAVHNPLSGELFTALRGKGAHRNGRPITSSGACSLRQALVAAGWPYERAQRARLFAQMDRVYQAAQELRTIGCASLALCLVASGVLDAYWEWGLGPWDLAAGVLVVSEAGGRVSSLAGGPLLLERGEVVASNGHIHAELLAQIKD